jgi:uncharacterized membrane protein YphA (DoxX/SURF4 family)
MIGASTTSPATTAPASPRPRAERRRRRVAADLLRLAFAALLLATGTAKLLDLPGFAQVVASYRLLPEILLLAAATALAAVELGLGLWLLAGRHVAQAALATVLLHLGYLAWLGVAFGRDLEIANCGCFGAYLPRPLTRWTLVEDGALLALSVLFYLVARRRRAGAGW